MGHSLSLRFIVSLVSSFAFGQAALAQLPGTADTSRIFNLGEVRVLGHCSLDSVNTATSRQFEAFNRLDVGRALNLLPGVNLSAVGARKESMVYVRGFDLRQVPVFIDGIPVYVRNYVLAEGFPEPGRNFFINLALSNL
jgi:iron complex outermembrane receptor protein